MMLIRFGQVRLKKSNGTMPPPINYTLKRFNRSSSSMKKHAKEQGSYGQKVRKQWRYPWKYKKFFSVKYKKAAIKLTGKKLRFSNGKQQSPLAIPQPKHIDFHTIKSAEIVWHKNQYWMHLAVFGKSRID
jgi:hypothetical protein